jgi:tRNA 2-thiouridine synthesizing protein A
VPPVVKFLCVLGDDKIMKYTLDAKRLLCPMPVIRAQDKIKTLNTGDILEVVCTDPGALQDVPAWCRINGHKVLETKTTDDEVFIIIEVSDV